MTYQPSQEILEKYADVMINFALNEGKGVQKGQTVQLIVPECAKPLLVELYKKVLQAGAHPLLRYLPDGMGRLTYEYGDDTHLDFFPEKLVKGRLEDTDCSVYVIAETNKKELEGIDPKKIMRNSLSMKKARDWQEEKENQGKFFWTLCMYGTQAMADEVNMSLEEYWQEIITACYLDQEDPVACWKEFQQKNHRARDWLNNLDIAKLHVKSEHIDLHLSLGTRRKWKGFSGHNIPSFEIFTSPDWRGTNGTIRFTEPLYRYGNLITGIELTFENGVVTQAKAEQGEETLKEMIATENADKVGEFSLTDASFSRITKFMGETLFDENVGGQHGNTHIALGNAYKDCFEGNPADISAEEWKELGYNESIVHTDIVSTAPRKVTATLRDGSEKVIYEHGHFCID